ncbi:hypothetical protein ABB37_01659 [Leptomonas pyrrhocoris]|uniref:DUF423-domain-containing protein n=1 Tax=Leptomonas pyrrhocoris TaxID=157538 RepID=A0A0M9G925_LEPPY|nr:hypothetical protein ABB37_01659 [Leptomonas pyrrhocoris]KPA85330.1 hypothetical protein ABB37_01659 [Leptomonas pyrrhocoris]|eukprot:XP_015663769.1 hypothetical protein ABB37_01659 [Leptomonas pyrrhocoris]
MMSLKSAHVPMMLVGAIGASSFAMDYVGSRLKTKLNMRQRRSWLIANQYHMSHTVALAAIAWMMTLAKESPEASSRLQKGFYLVMAGAFGFAGSIYSLSLRWCPKFMGPLTPTSGLVLVLGWINVGLAGLYW